MDESSFLDFLNSESYKRVQTAYNNILDEPTRKNLSQLQEQFNNLKPILNLVNLVNNIHPDVLLLARIYKYGWILTRNMERGFIDSLSEIMKEDHGQNIQSDIDKAIVNYCTKDNYKFLESIITNWKNSELLEPRYSILMGCFRSLQEPSSYYNQYDLTIPTLICQIDGILRDFIVSDGLTRDGLFFKENGNRVTLKKYFEEGRNHECIIDDMFSGFFSEHLYKSTDKEPISNLIINRHLIAHGIDLEYGTIENAIRLIFIIDIINEVYITRQSESQ